MLPFVLMIFLVSNIHCDDDPGLSDQVTNLPGLNFDISFNHYSGYLNASGGHHHHYWFVESQRWPSTDPLLLWLNGGPGCSSMLGLLTENGPFRLNAAGDIVHENIYSWNKVVCLNYNILLSDMVAYSMWDDSRIMVASVIYMESPAGVGFSYADDFPNGNVTTGDTETMEHNYHALVDWFRKFPSFVNRTFYLTGESYAGVYIPMLGAYIASQNTFPGNFKGIMIGNGILNRELNDLSSLLFLYNHGVFGDGFGRSSHSSAQAILPNSSIYDDIVNTCCIGCPLTCDNMDYMTQGNPDDLPWNINGTACYDNVGRAFALVSGLDPYNMYHSCYSDSAGSQYIDMSRFFQAIKKANKSILVYYGDADTVCNFLGGECFIESLKWKVTEEWQQWHYVKDVVPVGGYFKGFEGADFLTIRGSGHFVPATKPREALQVLVNFLRGDGNYSRPADVDLTPAPLFAAAAPSALSPPILLLILYIII